MVSHNFMTAGVNFCFGRFQNRISIFRLAVASGLVLFVVRELLSATTYQPMQSDANSTDDFRYRPRQEVNNSKVGEFLRAAEPYREFLDNPLSSAIELAPDNAENFIFVIASDRHFFYKAMGAIGNVQRYFPNRRIIYYDLEENKSPGYIAKIPGLCGVIYRKFDFSKYPSHVRRLYNYAWKPLIIAEVLSEYPILFYIDSAVRFLSNNLSVVFPQAIRNGGVVTFGHAGHTIFPTTHPGMFQYLPIPTAIATKVPMREAGHIYVARTRDIYANIIWWWTACALVEPCIAPTMNRFCKFHGMDVYANCHRFDQSAFNILLANHFVYDARAYSYANVTQSSEASVTAVRRESADEETVAICLRNGQHRLRKSSQYFG